MGGQLVTDRRGNKGSQLRDLVRELKEEVASLRKELAEVRRENLILRQEAGYWKSMHSAAVERIARTTTARAPYGPVAWLRCSFRSSPPSAAAD